MRLTMLDGFRGFFLFFMMIIHMNMEFNALIGKFNHHYFGWVEDAQGFVFISGLVIGLVYGKILIKRGMGACRSAVLKRIKTIYSYQAGLILIFLLMALILPVANLPGSALLPYTQRPISFTLESLMLITGSMHMGILPMYIWFMFLTPFVLWALNSGRGGLVIFISASAWLIGQIGLVDVADSAIEAGLAHLGVSSSVGIFFNLFGWQVLYFGGLYVGYLMAADRLDLSFLKDRQWYAAFWVGMGMVVVLGLFDRVIGGNLFGADFSKWLYTVQSRRDFTSLYVLAYGLDLFLVVWLLNAGDTCGNALVERLAALVKWVFTNPALVFLGQHSLQVFSAHILIVYAANILMLDRHVGTLTANLIVGLSPLPLFLVAWLHKRSLKIEAARKDYRTTIAAQKAKAISGS